MLRGSKNYELGNDRASQIIRNLSLIENALEPLILQATLPNPNQSIKGSIKNKLNIFNLVQSLINSVDVFISCSLEIFKNYKEVNSEIIIEIENLRTKSKKTITSSKEFANDLASSEKRVKLVKTARDLLGSVTRIMAIADILDSKKSSRIRKDIEEYLAYMQSSTTQEDLFENFKQYGEYFKELIDFTSNSLQNIKDPELCNKLVEARSILTKQNIFLYTSSKIALQHPHDEIATSLKDQVFSEVFKSLSKIDSLIQFTNPRNSVKRKDYQDQDFNIHPLANTKNCFTLLDELEKKIAEMDPVQYREQKSRIFLEQQVDETIKHITKSIITHSSSKLLEKCSDLRNALQDLFDSYEKNMTKNGNRMSTTTFNKGKNDFIKKTNSLRKLLRKTLLEQFTLKSILPIDQLIVTALTGQESETNEKILEFSDHANKLIEASLMACSLSNDSEGIRMVQMTIMQLRTLLPELIYSARLLCAYPMSVDIYKNMLVYKQAWLRETEMLLLTVDDIIDINDYLAASENHILADINKCIVSIQDKNYAELLKNSGYVADRTNRVCDLVTAEMNNYEACEFTENVIGIAYMLKSNALTNFAMSVDYATNALRSRPIQDPCENDFIDASRLIYDGIRDMRSALHLIGNSESSYQSDLDSDIEDNKDTQEVTNGSDQIINESSTVVDTKKNPPLDSNITKEQRVQIENELENFSKEKTNFEREVLKWDDKSNDIVVLAKEMCMIIMNMTDFMRGKGPLENTNDIIKGAKKVSSLGTRLEKLVKELANECPESKSKKDLLGYLKQLPLFCNQLNLGSKVKEYTFDPDSAASLIISSKNLMNAVMTVVQTSYVASTKYMSKQSNKKPIVQWKMKPPEKKPLVQKAVEKTTLIRKGSQKKKAEPVKILSEFQL